MNVSNSNPLFLLTLIFLGIAEPQSMIYQNLNNDGITRFPVRPAPPVMKSHKNGTEISVDLQGFISNNTQNVPVNFNGDDNEGDSDDFDEWDDASEFEEAAQPEANDPFDTSNIQVYDEPPDEQLTVTSTNCGLYGIQNSVKNELPTNNSAIALRSTQSVCTYDRNNSSNYSNHASSIQPTRANNLKRHENFNLNDQIENLWLKSISINSPQFMQNNDNSVLRLPSHEADNYPLVRDTLSPSLSSSPNKRRLNVTFSSAVSDSHTRNTFVFSHSSPYKDNISLSTPSLVPLPENSHPNPYSQPDASSLKSKENNFPKLDATFISELEKTLGKDQASANTYNCEEKHVTSPSLLPDKVSCYTAHPSQQGASHLHEFNLSASQPNLRQSVELSAVVNSQVLCKPKMNFTPFSDLDVLSSSRTLGLTPKEGLDMSRYFEKKSNQKNSSPPSILFMEKSNILTKSVGTSWQPSPNINPGMSPLTDGNNDHSSPFRREGRRMASMILAEPSFPSTKPLHNFANLNQRTTEILQPTVVVSPQLTVNYNQMVCSSGTGANGVNYGASGGEVLVGRVAAVVPGTSLSDAKQALHVSSGDYQGAVQFLKVEKLYRLGLTDKANCRRVLESNSWELERSASNLLDKFGLPGS